MLNIPITVHNNGAGQKCGASLYLHMSRLWSRSAPAVYRAVQGGTTYMNNNQDPSFLHDWTRRNLMFCSAASVMLCMLCTIGLVGTFTPLNGGQTLPLLNAPLVYAIIIVINLCFLLFFVRTERNTQDEQQDLTPSRRLILVFECTNMILASLTFFTTQKGSSFFFEYILVTVVVCLVPLYDLRTILRNVAVNVCTVLIVTRFTHTIAWQDWVDLGALQVYCVAITQLRWNSYVRYERLRRHLTQGERNAEKRAREDALTGLLNRTALRDDFSTFLNENINLSLIDIDAFKRLNDTFGHVHGDEVLSHLGQEIREIFPEQKDHCYRYGGDEFLIVTEGERQPDFAGRLKQLRDRSRSTAAGLDRTDLSAGFTSGNPATEQDLRTMIQTADHWLYEAKQSQTDNIQGGDMVSESADAESEGDVSGSPVMTLEKLEQMYTGWNGGTRTLVFFDIRQFAEINAHLGRYQGIRILNGAMDILSGYFGRDRVVHMDPDTFLAFSSGESEQAVELARRAQRKVSELIPFVNVILCVGVCTNHDADKTEDFLTAMDNARYACTQASMEVNGMRYLCVFDEKMRHSREIGTFIREHLEEALEQRRIVPYYQPLVGSISGKTCGFEALARWQDPERGMISPADFIPWLEELHLAYKLDLYMLRRVCEDIREHWISGKGDVFVTVNLSRTDFLARDMTEEVKKILSFYHIPKDMLQFEVTESALTDIDVIRDAVHDLENAGYQIWIDDFGTGQSSLSALGEIHAHGVKLDQAFFRNFREGSRQHIIIRSIAELCHHAGLLMIAEGVEDEKQLWYARNWGVNFIQGFFYSRPIPLEQVLESPFVKNMTTREIDSFYRSAMWVSLYRPLEQKYYAADREKMIYSKAVLERKEDQIYFVRMSHEMSEMFQPYFDRKNFYNLLVSSSEIQRELLKHMDMADRVHDVIDFSAAIGEKHYHCMLVHLSEHEGDKMYIFSLTNYGVVNPVPGVVTQPELPGKISETQ